MRKLNISILSLILMGAIGLFIFSGCCGMFDICNIPKSGSGSIENVVPMEYTVPQLVILEEPPQLMKVNISERVLFAFDSSDIDQQGMVIIQKVASFIEKYPDTSIVIQGHTDPIGTDLYNQGLSERRAESVTNALLENGVDPAAIFSVTAFGESQLISKINRENRRVMILSID